MKKYIVAIIGLIGAVLAALIITNFFSPDRNLEIRVYDLKSQKPIDNAIVKINSDTKPTGNDGIVVFSKFKKGYHEVSVSKENYKEYKGTVKIEGKENFNKVELEKKDEILPDNPRITFIEPQDESVQFSPVSLLGSSANLPKDKHYWIVVNPHGSNGWWPQTREIILKQNNRWSGVALLGGDKGQKFDIHFILADKQAHKDFNDYLTECAKNKDYPEKPLPLGSKSLGYLTLTKR